MNHKIWNIVSHRLSISGIFWSSSDSEVDSFSMISNVFALERDIGINRKKNRFYIRINKTREKASIRMVLRRQMDHISGHL
jgi:hypothetical protein